MSPLPGNPLRWGEPIALAMITSPGLGYVRDDGVAVIPVGALPAQVEQIETSTRILPLKFRSVRGISETGKATHGSVSIAAYQILTRRLSGRYIGSPGLIPNAARNSGTFASGPFTRSACGECTSLMICCASDSGRRSPSHASA